jgi:hypothetical protein
VLRFAVHRLGQRRASPRSHGTPCRDIPRRIQISIAGIGAGDTAEESLALATLRSDIPTHRTTLTRKRGIDPFQPTGGFVLQTGSERRPRGMVDRPIETSLLPNIPARLLDGAPRRTHHVRHWQVLDPDHVIPAGDDRRRLLHEIPPPISHTSMQSRQPSLRPTAPVRAAPAPRQRASRLPSAEWRRRFIGSPIGQGHCDGDATVDTDHAAVTGTVQRCGDHRERNMPTPRRIQGHPIGLPVRQGTGASEPDPTDLGNQNPRPVSVDLLHPQGLRTDDTETLMPAPLTPRRPPMTTTPPIRHRLGEVSQRLLPHRLRTRTQPLTRGTSLGQLPALLNIVRETLPMMPIPELLHREIPHEPGVRTMLREQHLLLARRIHTEPHNRNLTAAPDNSGFLPTLNGRVSARDSR